MSQYNLTGIWKSHYKYPSSTRKGEFEGDHYLRVFQKGNQLVAESVPKVNKSYVVIKLSIDTQDDIATGSWQEVASPDGYYKGAVYHGAIQLALDKDKRHMAGKWLGFGKDREINVGPWELSYIGPELPDSLTA